MEQDGLSAYRDYLHLKGYTKKNIASHLRIAGQYLAYTPAAGVDFISHLQNRPSRNDPSRKLSPAGLRYYFYCLKAYISYDQMVTGSRHNLYIPAIRKSEPLTEILSEGEVKSLFAFSRDLRDKAILSLLYHAGLRIGEAARLLIADIDMRQGLLTITKSKTGRQRQVPVNSRAREILRAYIEQERPFRDTGALLQGLSGDLGAHGIEFNLKAVVKRSGIEKRVYAHLLRHSIASHLLQRGMPLEQVSLFLGHTSLESTRRYTHIQAHGLP
jgi:site-specific recombinase XerD